jgi:hypothetical protein
VTLLHDMGEWCVAVLLPFIPPRRVSACIIPWMHCAAQDMQEMRTLHTQLLAHRGAREVNLPPIDARKSESDGPILLLIFDGGGTRGIQTAQVVAPGHVA